MSPLAGIWIPGAMPVQLLLLFASTFLLAVVTQDLFQRIGRPITPFWQVVGFWLLAYGLLRWVVWPPLPWSVMAIYMGLVTLILFVWVSATERTWREFTRYVMATLTGASPGHRLLRAALFIVLPLTAVTGSYTHARGPQKVEAPLEFRGYHPAPPRSIEVQGQVIDLQTAKNPYRVR